MRLLMLITISFIIAISMISLIKSISFNMSGDKDVCFFKFFQEEEKMYLEYLISGEEEGNTKVIMLDPSSQELFSRQGEDEGKFEGTAKVSGEYQVCFFPNTRAENSVVIDLSGENDSSHLSKVAKGQSLTDMQKDLYSIDSVFDQIETNVKSIIERQTAHTESNISI